MKLIKCFYGHYRTEDGKYTVNLSNDRIKGLHPKWYVSAGVFQNTHVATLKEAKAVIENWERNKKDE